MEDAVVRSASATSAATFNASAFNDAHVDRDLAFGGYSGTFFKLAVLKVVVHEELQEEASL